MDTPLGLGSVNGVANGNCVVNLDEGETIEIPLRDVVILSDPGPAPDEPEAEVEEADPPAQPAPTKG